MQDEHGTATWLGYSFGVYRHDDNWTAIAGLYVFAARELDDQRTPVWRPLYVGQTTSLVDRIPTHYKWPEAVRSGATHVHARREG